MGHSPFLHTALQGQLSPTLQTQKVKKKTPQRGDKSHLPKTMVMNFSSTPTSSSSGGT